jgi:hypothetical protein
MSTTQNMNIIFLPFFYVLPNRWMLNFGHDRGAPCIYDIQTSTLSLPIIVIIIIIVMIPLQKNKRSSKSIKVRMFHGGPGEKQKYPNAIKGKKEKQPPKAKHHKS